MLCIGSEKFVPLPGRRLRINCLANGLGCLSHINQPSLALCLGTTQAKAAFVAPFVLLFVSLSVLSWWFCTGLHWYAHKTAMGNESMRSESGPHNSYVSTSGGWYRSSQTQLPWNQTLSLCVIVIWRKWTQESSKVISALQHLSLRIDDVE